MWTVTAGTDPKQGSPGVKRRPLFWGFLGTSEELDAQQARNAAKPWQAAEAGL